MPPQAQEKNTVAIKASDKCGKCKNDVKKQGIKCTKCDKLYHRSCQGVKKGAKAEYFNCDICKGKDCELCAALEFQVKEEKAKNQSLEKINEILVGELEELREEIQKLKQRAEEKEWVRVEKPTPRARRWSASGGLPIRQNQNHEKTINRFEVLNDMQDFPPLQPINFTGKPSGPKKKKKGKKAGVKEILIVADSQGRDCSSMLKEELSGKLNGNFEVCGIVKPNGKLKDVVEHISNLVEDFTKDDCVIVMGGTNDVEEGDNYRETIMEGVQRALPVSCHTNIIFNSIPMRFDRYELSPHVHAANHQFYTGIQESRYKNPANIRLNSNEHLSRDCFTRHGLHLNRRGKREVCKRLSGHILECLNRPNFLD